MKIEDFKGFKVDIDFDDIVEKTATELAENIRQASITKLSNRATGKYASSWTHGKRKDSKGTYEVVYNAEHYRLTHLLEHGHVVRNKYGTYGRTAPNPIIKTEFDRIKDKFVEDMKQAKLKVE